MDPYLEGEMWQEFHATLANAIRAQVLATLPPRYTALLAKRYVLDYRIVEEVPHLSIEIRDVAERLLVTLIEILSPANKEGQGASDYNRRRRRLLKRDVHLLEIDLLRGGRRITLWGDLPPGVYYVYLSRFDDRPTTEVWPIGLRQRLPMVPVPLLEPDPDVVLDLQAAVNACFDLVHYERLLDYAGLPPPPPLSVEDAAWVAESLRAAGLRA
jgi:hypothetical protein